MRRMLTDVRPALVAAALALSVLDGASASGFDARPSPSVLAQQRQPPRAILWRDPGAVESLDFVHGAGGRENAPTPPFTFLKENRGGSNPKINVTDANGTKWGVKWGSEVNAEVFASRLVWASGYFVEPAYFVKSGKIDGVTGLRRARKHVAADGSFADARFELREKGVDKLEGDKSWAWGGNPFAGARELNGLKVVMMLVSNWDSKDARDASRGSNTKIFRYTLADGTVEARYLVTDWGGSMGKWGGFFGRKKWDCEGYAEQTPKFVEGVEGGVVAWGYSGQRTSDIRDGIRVSDVKWVMQYLGRVTDEQLRAGLEASGASPDEVACFATAVRARLDQLTRLQ